MNLDSLNASLAVPGTVICRMPGGEDSKWGLLRHPTHILQAHTKTGMQRLFKKIERMQAEGRWLAGFISYQAASCFDPALALKPDSGEFPLAWFGVYPEAPYAIRDFPEVSPGLGVIPELRPELEESEYLAALERLKDYITAGDSYQVNHTFRCRGRELAHPGLCFLALASSHPVPHAAFVNTGEWQVISVSPELFLEKRSSKLRSRPMKGTMPRALRADLDARRPAQLASDPKNRAENVMIVDMVRNDLGRICAPGSIKVEPLFHVETYATVHQMISEVHGELKKDCTLWDIFAASFPAASITGAPKVRATEIIRELENSPRRLYTGSVGCFAPGGDFSFNVAIRTLVNGPGGCELGVGGGIVADSEPEAEWREAILKSAFTSFRLPDFEMLETILWTDSGSYLFLEEHIARAAASQRYFQRPWNEDSVRNCLHDTDAQMGSKIARVRLSISADGRPKAEAHPLPCRGWGKEILRVKIAEERTHSQDVFLYHKTTHRSFYNEQYRAASASGFDEILFQNERGEITEGAISSLFIRKGESWFTPSLDCGLLPGIWRASQIAKLSATEKIILPQELLDADEIIVGNSVRGAACVKLANA